MVDAVDDRIPVLLDSGIRTGADIFKALALGARAVLLGRPWVYGLALAGEDGVREVLQNFQADFDLTMGLAGCASVGEITREALVRVRGSGPALVFAASGAVLVLEILAIRLLAPFVGSTLETYTVIIGTVLAGIAVGARRRPARPRGRPGQPSRGQVIGLCAAVALRVRPPSSSRRRSRPGCASATSGGRACATRSGSSARRPAWRPAGSSTSSSTATRGARPSCPAQLRDALERLQP